MAADATPQQSLVYILVVLYHLWCGCDKFDED
jgi:hypothetical protein